MAHPVHDSPYGPPMPHPHAPTLQIGDPVARHIHDLEARAKVLPGFADGRGW